MFKPAVVSVGVAAAAFVGCLAGVSSAAAVSVQQPGTASVIVGLTSPIAVAESASGDLYVAGVSSARVLIWERPAGEANFVVVAGSTDPAVTNTGNGPATDVRFQSVAQMAMASDGSLLIADPEAGRLRRLADGVLTTVAGNGSQDVYGGDHAPVVSTGIQPTGVAVAPDGHVYLTTRALTADSGGLIGLDANGTATTLAGGGSTVPDANVPALDAWLEMTGAVATSTDGAVYFIQRTGSTGAGWVERLSGDTLEGVRSLGGFDNSSIASDGLAFDSDGVLWVLTGNVLYGVTDAEMFSVSPYAPSTTDPASPSIVPLMQLRVSGQALGSGSDGSVLLANTFYDEVRRMAGAGIWPNGWAPAKLDPVDKFPGGHVSVYVRQAGADPSYLMSGGYAPNKVASAPLTKGPTYSPSLQERFGWGGVTPGPGTVTVRVDGAERYPGGGTVWTGDPITRHFRYPTRFPAQPQSLTAKQFLPGCAELRWDPVASADHYVVQGDEGTTHPVRPFVSDDGSLTSQVTTACPAPDQPTIYTYTVWAVTDRHVWSRPAHVRIKLQPLG